ncbi:N-acyl homoserine lactonase family protein [Sulfolobus tengchongensis]|uniref:N-acyl homoserine lactonase family protein n=1 Tax=Sulfolobus tengchongensis TaxID=207809 RepID=A0AAX4KXM8_9CREN
MDDGFSLLDLGYNYHSKSILIADAGNEMVKVPIVGVVIKKKDLKILFDTGPDIRKKYPIMTRLNTTQTERNLLYNQLKLIGLEIKDIDLVVVSHLHYDHAGFLAEFKRTPILVQKDELRYAYYPDWYYREVYNRQDFDYYDLEYITINGDYKIEDGIEIISLPGHTPGTQGLIVAASNGGAIFTSDALYTLENLIPVKRKQGLDWSTGLWGESVDRIKLTSKLKKLEIFPGHDEKFYSTKEFAPRMYPLNW